MLIEVDPRILRAQRCCEDRIVEILASYDYQFYVADRKKLVPFQLPMKEDLLNIFCLS